MKHHYGEEYVGRISKDKKLADGKTWRTRQERQEVSREMKRGRRTARRKAREECRKYIDK
jgi:hypothetical protein